MKTYQVDKNGYYGEFGGAYVPEILHQCVENLQNTYRIIHNLWSDIWVNVYFQVYEIAPYVTGIPEFYISVEKFDQKGLKYELKPYTIRSALL